MPLHLRKRAGIWHYSRTVPADVRGLIAKRHWRFTLGTDSLREAEAKRSEWDAKHQAIIDNVRRMSAGDKIAAIRNLNKPAYKGLAPVGKRNGIEVHRLAVRKRDIYWRRGKQEDSRAAYAEAEKQALEEAAKLLPSLGPEEQEAVDRAGGLGAFYKRVVRDEDSRDLLGDYRHKTSSEALGVAHEVRDRLLGNKKVILSKLGFRSSQVDEIPEDKDNPRLLAALEDWLAEHKQKPSTATKYRLHVRRLTEHAGNLTVKSLTPDIITRFVEAYGRLPNARALQLKQRKLSMSELLALRVENPSLPSMGAVNVGKMVEYLRAYLRAVKRDDLRLFAKKPKDDRPHATKREGFSPFKPEAMRLLLPAVDEAFGPQSDTAWWVWLLAYSGMRPEESAQLARANVLKQGSIWAFQIDDLEERRVKNAQSLRTIPVHPVLIENGFLDFAHPNGDTDGLLFNSFDYDDKGGRANNPSRRLKALLNKLGIRGKGSAHRFRASFIDAIRNAALPYSIELGLVGHADKNRVHGGYGDGASLKTMAKAIRRVDPLKD